MGKKLLVRSKGIYYLLHHNNKFIVKAGIFNYNNKHKAENALVLWNVPQIAAIYAKERERLWGESK